MSAVVAAKYPSCVRILTDGAVYNPDHVLTGSTRKVWAARNLPIAISGRGRHRIVEHIATSIARAADVAPSVDDMIDIIIPEYLAHLQERSIERFELTIAAWSETDGPKLCFAAPDNSSSAASIKPFTLIDRQEVWAAPLVSYDEMARFLRGDLEDPGFLSRNGADLMEVMRSKPSSLNPDDPTKVGPGYFGIGCFCDLTTVTAAGVETVRLREWKEDRVGQRINPAPTASPKPPLNRHERRAMARRAA